ncbi:hypothetical protein ACN469_39115 [Corallococcus terminator]
MKNGWLRAGVFAVVMTVVACGGTEEDVTPEQVPSEGLQEAQPGDTHQQAIRCDAAGRCPVNFYCDVSSTCRFIGGHW